MLRRCLEKIGLCKQIKMCWVKLHLSSWWFWIKYVVVHESWCKSENMARSMQMIRTMQYEEGMTHFTDLDVSTFLLSWGFMSKFGLFSCLLKLTFKSLLIFRFCRRRHGWWKLRYLSAFFTTTLFYSWNPWLFTLSGLWQIWNLKISLPHEPIRN